MLGGFPNPNNTTNNIPPTTTVPSSVVPSAQSSQQLHQQIASRAAASNQQQKEQGNPFDFFEQLYSFIHSFIHFDPCARTAQLQLPCLG